MTIDQYDIVVVNLDPTVGSEIKKTRPCLVVSPNEINRNLNTIIIVPLTSAEKSYPTRVPITSTSNPSWAVIEQIRTIDKKRVLRVKGKIEAFEIRSVKSILKETLVD